MDGDQRTTATPGAGHHAATERVLAQGAARYWWVVLLAGVAWLFVAWLVLRMDVRSLVAVGTLLGVVLLGAALDEAALAGTVRGGWKVLHYVVAAAFAVGAGWSFLRPVDSFFALVSVLGLVLVVMGAFEIVRALAVRGDSPLWWTGLLSGALMLLLAVWVSSSDRVFPLLGRTALILLWVGFMALFRGFSHVMLAFAVRRLGQEAGARGAATGPDVRTR